jgi:uncharacterized membrane protein
MDDRVIKHPPRLRGHSAHPPLTDFPIALLAISLVWDVIAIGTGGDIWWKMAFWSQVAGLIAVVPAALTGFVEYIALPPEHSASSTAMRHMLVMVSATIPYIGSVIARGGSSTPTGNHDVVAVALNVLGLGLLLLGGWLGGELVSRHGLGTIAETTGLTEQSAVISDHNLDGPARASLPGVPENSDD